MVEYIRSDLEAILFHIKIAEANAAGQPLYGPGGLIPTYNLSWGLRTVDGSYNNLIPGREYWGASNQPFPSHVDPSYRNFLVDMNGAAPGGLVPVSYAPTLTDPDGPGRAVAGDVYDPALRTISNLIVDQTLSNPAAIMESMRRDGIEGDLLQIALEIQSIYQSLPVLERAAVAARIAETTALGIVETETSEQALAGAAATLAATALTLANDAVAQDVVDLAAATAASDSADVAVGVAQAASTAAQAALVVAQSAYDAAASAVGATAGALSTATTDLAAATLARETAANGLAAAVSSAAAMAAAEADAADALLVSLGIQAQAQTDYATAQSELAAADGAVTAAQAALGLATSNSDDADAALASAQAAQVAAQADLDAAQGVYDAAVIANEPSAATLAAAVTTLADATAAYDTAVATTIAAQATASAMQQVEEDAIAGVATAQADQIVAQDLFDAAALANAPTATVLAAAAADLATATSAHDLAVQATGVALANQLAMQGLEAEATTGLATARENLIAAQDAFDAATLANQPSADALALANAGLATATTAHGVTLDALASATTAANDAQAAEDTAAGNLAFAVADRDAAVVALAEAEQAVVAYDTALAASAGGSADAASTAVGALVDSLGSVEGDPVDGDDLAAVGTALSAANEAYSTATGILNLLLTPGVAQADRDSAQATVTTAESLIAGLEALELALQGDATLDQSEIDAATAAQGVATTLVDQVNALASNMNLVGRPAAQEAVVAADDYVFYTNIVVGSATNSLNSATAASNAADQALGVAQADELAARTVRDDAQAAVDAAVAANQPTADALAVAAIDLAAATIAVPDAENALANATANREAADGELAAAQGQEVLAQVARDGAQTAFDEAVLANQPTADALASATANLAAADGALVAAQDALAAATVSSDAADAAVVLAQGSEVAAQGALDAAQTAHGAAVLANEPTAAALATATTELATAASAYGAAATAVATAAATAAAMQALEEAALADLTTAQGVQSTAQTALANAETALIDANEGVTAAQGVLGAATANSDLADAALVTAQDDDAAAVTALASAQSSYDAAFAAGGTAAAALTAATTALTDATAARDVAGEALTSATLAAAEAQALEESAVNDLAASHAAQATAIAANDSAQAALATADAELAAAQLAAGTATAAVTTADNNVSAASAALDGLLLTNGIELEGDNVILPNVATDEGLSAPFNSWFTLFGQFFDHGLDLVGKGGSGTVFIPLQKDDPLYDPGPDGIAGNADDSRTNFMVLTRATTSPGADGVFGTDDDILPMNATTSFVDQNQTYGSHSSHQVFLREYELTATGPKPTGRLIEGPNGGMANWGQLKEYSRTQLGIELTDHDVGMVPLLRTDAYGNFIPGANGFPQVIIGIGADGIPNTSDDLVVEGDPTANGGKGVSVADAIRTASAFILDIAHNAAPNGVADADNDLGLDNLGGATTGIYDNELLDRHFIAGDGRVNENIGLVAVHAIFHAEHNRMAEHTKAVVLADAQKLLAGGASQAEAVAFLNEWLEVDVTEVPTTMAGLEWDGERVFQAAKFGTEMQYQHLVFEEFARKIQPSINVFIVPDGYDATINPSIMAEFAHVVYRFGHSMLTETVDRFDANFTPDHIGLIEAFLNPVEFDADGLVMDGIAIGDIVRGMTRQTGAQIDEFVTSALRDNLLGLPLDLATLNLARGRDTGTPSLNAARREFYEVTNNNPALKPYDSWADFAAHLKNEASIINFVAAYGTHSLITGQTTIEGKRNAALTIITGESFGGLVVPADATDFLNATGAFAGGKLGGLEDVDLWIGGLAEATMPFGGMLGSTFNFVFEVQMESLQNGDRFYYLQRNTGQHLFEQLEANSLASMIMRHSDATHLPGDVFSDPGLNLEVDQTKQFNDLNGDGTLESDDPVAAGLVTQLVIRNNPATAGADANYIRYTGEEHIVLGGTGNNDTLIAGIGDDTIHGDAGDDRIEGGFGNDEIRGGDGDDIITDIGGDDTLKGGKGNDTIHGGSGIDLILAGDGNDFIVMGNDGDGGAFGGLGNDFMLMNLNSLPAFGNEGDDWIEDGANAGMFGDNLDDGFARDGIWGNDVMVGVGGGFDEYVGEGGDDIMVGSLGSAKHAGMSGFDWVTYKNLSAGIDASFLDDFLFDEAPTDPADIALQRFESVEGLSGSRFNDRLTGSDFVSADRVGGGPDHAFLGSFIDARSIALIDGLQGVLGAGVTFYDAGDIILGGDGNDEIVGGGGNDIIDGDKWLNVRISVRANKDGTGPEIASANSMTELSAKLLDGTYNPGQLVIVREILTADGTGDVDTARYSGLRAEYDLVRNADGTLTVSHVDGNQLDGVDTLRNIEALRFADQTIDLLAPLRVDLHAFDLVTTVVSNFADNFDVQSFTNSSGTTPWTTSWVETNDGANTINTGQIQTNAGGTLAMRFAAGDGASITRAVSLDPAVPTTLSYTYGYSGFDTGDTLTVQFAADGINFVTVQTITGAVANNANLGPTPASFAVTGSATSAVRFTVSALSDIEAIRIDNLSLVSGFTAPVAANDGTGFTATFTEDGPGVAIALNSAVTDPVNQIAVSAQVRLTNAQALDALSIAGALPGGITSTINNAVPGQITLNLTGAASLTDYQAAIQAVRFANSSNNPSLTPRTIEVTVTNSEGTAPAAIATVNIVPVNDGPVTVADAVVTNVSSGNLVIPEWVLLANDSDPEGSPLDVVGAFGAVGLTGLSLTTNPGSVTMAEDGVAGGSFVYTATDGDLEEGVTNGTVTVTNTGFTSLADNFQGLNNATPSAANNSTGTTSWTGSSWTEVNDDGNIRTGQIQIDAGAAPGTNDMRFGVGDGASISRVVNLAGVTNATLSLAFDKNNIDVGESVQVQFAADGVNYVTLSTITNANNTAVSGNAAGTLSLALTGALGANSTIRFVGSAINAAGEDIRLDNVVVSYGAANAAVTAGAGNQILIGNEAGSQFTGGAGDDTVLANGGNDVINWSVGHGRDFVDGGANGAAGDRFIVNGNGTVEAFVVYARAEAIAAGVEVRNAATEIVITRNGVGNVVAELDNVEEITINTGAGADTVVAVGNFGPTSLFFNTITVNGQGGRDTIDASLLTSAHKLVLNRGPGGNMGALDAVDGLGNFGKSLMMRLDNHDLDFYGEPALADLGAERVFVADGKYNPMAERAPAIDLVGDLPAPPQYQDSALHLYAADYLII